MRHKSLSIVIGLVLPLAVLLAGCSPFTSPRIERTSPGTSVLPGGQPTGPGTAGDTAEPAQVSSSKQWHPGGMQYGLQVYAHTAHGKPADANIASILDYVVRRGANSVAYSFPLYTDGMRPTKVYAGAETPTPKVVAHLVSAANARGLRVMVRPIIDEENLRTTKNGWRGAIRPKSLGGWFTSYEQAVRPYLQAAGTSSADEFVLATELTSLQPQHARWRALAAWAARIFPGTLSYTFNWDVNDEMLVAKHGAVGIDMYFAVDLGPDATVDQLTSALTQQLQAKPKALRSVMVAQEVGIAGENGAYREPWNWGIASSSQPNPAIQANWFSAACRAVRQSDLKGIYFWMLDSSTDPKQVSPTTEGPAGFVGRPGEKSIERCFAGQD